jgi:hypothetical protein
MELTQTLLDCFTSSFRDDENPDTYEMYFGYNSTILSKGNLEIIRHYFSNLDIIKLQKNRRNIMPLIFYNKNVDVIEYAADLLLYDFMIDENATKSFHSGLEEIADQSALWSEFCYRRRGVSTIKFLIDRGSDYLTSFRRPFDLCPRNMFNVADINNVGNVNTINNDVKIDYSYYILKKVKSDIEERRSLIIYAIQNKMVGVFREMFYKLFNSMYLFNCILEDVLETFPEFANIHEELDLQSEFEPVYEMAIQYLPEELTKNLVQLFVRITNPILMDD